MTTKKPCKTINTEIGGKLRGIKECEEEMFFILAWSGAEIPSLMSYSKEGA